MESTNPITPAEAAELIAKAIEPLENVFVESSMTDEVRTALESIRYALYRAGLYTYAEE